MTDMFTTKDSKQGTPRNYFVSFLPFVVPIRGVL